MIKIEKVWFDDLRIFVVISDGRIIGTPIAWYPNLRKGSADQLQKFEIWGNGTWLHWEDLDEDLSLEGFFTFRQESSKA